MFGEIVWSLWIQRCAWSFEETDDYSPATLTTRYRERILERVHMDRHLTPLDESAYFIILRTSLPDRRIINLDFGGLYNIKAEMKNIKWNKECKYLGTTVLTTLYIFNPFYKILHIQ